MVYGQLQTTVAGAEARFYSLIKPEPGRRGSATLFQVQKLRIPAWRLLHRRGTR